ncbi:MAG: protein kinase [Elainellaceae cyanobacterium]
MALNFLQSFRSGRTLGGRYILLKQLGIGGFGHTFLAQDLHLPGQPQCVIKQLKPHDQSDQHLQLARRLFDTEARALYELGAHPHIPRLLAHFEDADEFYLAQELIEGHSLVYEFKVTPWNEAKVVAFLGDVLGTLTFVHDRRVIHRDLKPSNLIRRHSDGRIVLIDFGAVKQASTQLTSAEPGQERTIAIGTQGYMANEQLAGQPRYSSDIYAVGIMAIQAATGQHPAELARDPHTSEIDWHDCAPDVSAALKSVVDTMVCYDFRARYPTAQKASAALEALPPELSQHLPSQVSDSQIGVSHSPSGARTAEADGSLPLTTPQPKTEAWRLEGTMEGYSQPLASAMAAPGANSRANSGAIRKRSGIRAAAAWVSLKPRRSLTALMAFTAVVGTGIGIWRARTPVLSGLPTVSEQVIETDEPTTEADEPATEADELTSQVSEPVIRVREITPDLALATITEFYSQVSAQSWDGARALTAGALAEEFDPAFFEQFQEVSVENLRVVEQTGRIVLLSGQNTYFYSDGSSQREARMFTIQLVDGQPRVIGSDFVRIIRQRS